jgi:hypothetical protein
MHRRAGSIVIRTAGRKMTTPRRLALVLGLPLAIGLLLSLAQCDSDGITPVCPPAGGDCITPAGTSSASVVIVSGGSGGTAGSANAGGSAGTTAAGGGSGSTAADGGLLSLLDAALDLGLGH